MSNINFFFESIHLYAYCVTPFAKKYEFTFAITQNLNARSLAKYSYYLQSVYLLLLFLALNVTIFRSRNWLNECTDVKEQQCSILGILQKDQGILCTDQKTFGKHTARVRACVKENATQTGSRRCSTWAISNVLDLPSDGIHVIRDKSKLHHKWFIIYAFSVQIICRNPTSKSTEIRIIQRYV